MAHYLFNLVQDGESDGRDLRTLALESLRASVWGVDAQEPHRDALAVGDLVLVYVGPPEQVFLGHAEVASTVHPWTPSELQEYPGSAPAGVTLSQVEEWDPPVPMSTVLARIDPSENAGADFHAGVVRITTREFEGAISVAAGQ